ncbi:MAG: AAA family ATPase [Magnetospirillum sp.]|nr:AAA family ATPase [Magnetospirillum sp.]
MKSSRLTSPFLRSVSLVPEKVRAGTFPFGHPAFLDDQDFALGFGAPITILVGENGSGKSTLIEAIATAAGFPALGGSQDHRPGSEPAANALALAMRLSWLPKVSNGFFFRAESFFGLASYLDDVADLGNYGERALHRQSHGESFLALFRHRLETHQRALYLLDEPEVALSPMRQLAFLRILREWQRSGRVQAVIATHSPILMALPGAALLSLDGGSIQPVSLEDTEHYRVTRSFLANPEKVLRDLFDDP